jgi:tripartite-type tricarboxylate transporter receptor subunit TctC
MPQMTRRIVLAGLSACAALPARAAGSWPDRPITLIHGFPPGGPVDVLARILVEPLARHLGQPVIIEAKPGATGTTAAGLVARAAPDGYTLLALPGTFAATSVMFQTLPYNPTEDFTFISSTAESPLVLVTNSNSEFQTVADILRIARARAMPLLYGTAGIGSIQHLTMELFAKKANIQLQHVPFKGGLPAITELLGRRLDLVLDPPTALVQFVRDGKLRALAVTGANRLAEISNVPTMIESGFSGFVVTACQGIAAPAHLPADVTMKLNRTIAILLTDTALIGKLAAIASSPQPSSPEGYKARVVAEIALWNGVVEDAHIARI